MGDRPASHDGDADTSQGHSGVVVTLTVPLPPPGPMLDDEAASATWHFSGVAAVVTVDSDPHALASMVAVTVAAKRSSSRG
jgi:hypothetical protein